jgi:hypothetical protein
MCIADLKNWQNLKKFILCLLIPVRPEFPSNKRDLGSLRIFVGFDGRWNDQVVKTNRAIASTISLCL